MPFICALFGPLFITIITEMLVLFLWREKKLRIYALSIFINIITNLSLNIILSYANPRCYYGIIGSLEAVIVFIEAFAYNLIYKNLKKSFIISLLCNITSFTAGILLLWN